MSWVQTAYLIAEVVAIPLTGLLTRLLTLRWLFVLGGRRLHVGVDGLRREHAASSTLIAFGVVQGFSGGTLIPAVFSAVFLLFPIACRGWPRPSPACWRCLRRPWDRSAAAGSPQTPRWHWLFLINVAPGIVAAAGARNCFRARPDGGRAAQSMGWRSVLLAMALSSLEIGLKEAPDARVAVGDGVGAACISLRLPAGVRASVADHRAAGRGSDARCGERNFAIGCVLSFVLGIGLFGSVYLMPVFLAFVRGHGALQIGEIMLVTGGGAIGHRTDRRGARTADRRAPAEGVWVFVVRRRTWPERLQTSETDFSEMIIPQ